MGSIACGWLILAGELLLLQLGLHRQYMLYYYEAEGPV
jgi:hypothetical protein